jgi:protein-disulfide isomerase
MKTWTILLLVCAVVLVAMPRLSAAAEMAHGRRTGFTPAQQEELKRFIRDYLVNNPEVLKEAALALHAKEEAAQAEKRTVALGRKELLESPEGTVIGNPKGDVTVVEFFDYNCGYCKAFFPTLMDTLKSDSNIRVVLKEFPILATSSITAAKAAMAAAKQNKYAEMHTALISHKGALNEETIMSLAKGVGLDTTRLQADMKAPELDAVIKQNEDLADALQITGTPALIIGKTVVAGAIGKDKLKELVAAARTKS